MVPARQRHRRFRIAATVVAALSLAACGSTADDPATERPLTTVDAGTSITGEVPPSATAAEAAPGRSMTVAATGDILPHSPLWRRALANSGGVTYDFAPMFADIEPAISAADLAICHLETPIAPEGEEFTTDPLYGVPPQIADAIAAAGYDRCSTASNHVLDRRVAGIDRTIDMLEANGVGHSGTARSAEDSLPVVFAVNDIRVAHLAYTYATNGIPIPADEPWRTNLIDPVRIVRDASVARDLGAEVVIVSMHWGTERESAPNAEQVRVADEVTASGEIDLIIGHHAHVVQPLERINGVWVAYGTGNVLSNLPVSDFWPANSQDAVIVEFAIGVDAAGTVSVDRPTVRPTWVDKNDGWVIRDIDVELARTDLGDNRRTVLAASRERTAAVLGEFMT